MNFGLGLARNAFSYKELPKELQGVAQKVDIHHDGNVSVYEATTAAEKADASPEMRQLKAAVDSLETRSAWVREAPLWPVVAVGVVAAMAVGSMVALVKSAVGDLF